MDKKTRYILDFPKRSAQELVEYQHVRGLKDVTIEFVHEVRSRVRKQNSQSLMQSPVRPLPVNALQWEQRLREEQ